LPRLKTEGSKEMEVYNLDDFFKGWIVGNFSPSLFVNSEFEVGVKFFKKGDVELAHKQLTATEITVVIEGNIRLSSFEYSRGDVILIPPNEVANFESLTDSSLVCIKYPSIPNDKMVEQ
jgi:quercetin dioxygenase-like cupin family protein